MSRKPHGWRGLVELVKDIGRAERECRRQALDEASDLQRKFREQVDALHRDIAIADDDREGRHGRLDHHPR